MTAITKERSYNSVIAHIGGSNKVNNSFKQKVGRDDRGNINPNQDIRNSKAWVTDGTMYMNE